MIVLKLVAGDRNIFFPRYFSNFYTFFKDRKKSAASDHSEAAELLSDILSPTTTYLLNDTLRMPPIFFRYQRLIVALI